MYRTGSGHPAAGEDDEEALIAELLDRSEEIKRYFFGNDEETPAVTPQDPKPPFSRENEGISTCLTLKDSLKRKPSHRTRRARPAKERCTHCSGTNLVRDETHGDVVCTDCATCHVDRVTDEAFKSLSFQEFSHLRASSESHRKKNVYKKKNYFGEVLSHITGEDDAVPPVELLQAVQDQHACVQRTGPVSAVEVRAALKRMKARKEYKHAWSIARTINGQRGLPTEGLSHTEQDLLRYMFSKVHRLFYEVRGLRKNCLNYCYVIHQMLYLMNRSDLASHVPMLKTRFRLEQHDNIWKSICERTGWEFRSLCPERSRR